MPSLESVNNQQSAMMKTDAGTCASLSVSLLTTSSRLSNHFLLYTPIDLYTITESIYNNRNRVFPREHRCTKVMTQYWFDGLKFVVPRLSPLTGKKLLDKSRSVAASDSSD